MITEKTVKMRHQIAYGVLTLLAPKLKKNLTEAYYLRRDLPRPFTKMLRQQFGDKPLIGAEIGFGYGENALSLTEELNIKKLYCVDPYFGASSYQDTGFNVDWYTTPAPADLKRMAQLRKNPNIQFIKECSDACFKRELVPYGLDFVYIDGNHSGAYCYRDIANAMVFTRKGGFVGGHDFAHVSFTEVSKAVFRYATEKANVPEMVFPDYWFKVV